MSQTWSAYFSRPSLSEMKKLSIFSMRNDLNGFIPLFIKSLKGVLTQPQVAVDRIA